ncbi:hypothetical protein E2C01_054754 [Portunus trituberculatus]|uniref:Uncharacterized protein n=1 Tax=Portunus trituberculatus TaxID=210409 RepID=A0A5B7GUS6_PORTR|nr:hypothetical protein [Portunus trituberculatus]
MSKLPKLKVVSAGVGVRVWEGLALQRGDISVTMLRRRGEVEGRSCGHLQGREGRGRDGWCLQFEEVEELNKKGRDVNF